MRSPLTVRHLLNTPIATDSFCKTISGTVPASVMSRRNSERSFFKGRRSMVDTAIFLGAGASKAEGAPLQGELFWEYFSSPTFRSSRDLMDRELTAFFSEMFNINVKRRDLK